MTWVGTLESHDNRSNVALSLQWHHMSIQASHCISHSDAHQVIRPTTKKSVMWKVCPCRDLIMTYLQLIGPWEILKNLRKIILKLIWVTDGCDISSEIALRWTSLDLSDDKSKLVQGMAWCCQATSHYLNNCWPGSLLPYGVTRPQWVNITQHWTKHSNDKGGTSFGLCTQPMRDGVTL